MKTPPVPRVGFFVSLPPSLLRWGLVLGFMVYGAMRGLMLGLLLALPANPDPVEMPADLVWTFRLISFVGLLLFWMVLAGMFGWFARDTSPTLVPHSA
jgi:hypothetical protein